MAKAMRNILIDLARADRAEKRPQSRLRVVDTNAVDSVAVAAELDPLDFYESLDALRTVDARQADIVELRIVGLANKEIAQDCKISESTVKRDLAAARAFLAFRLGLPADWIQT
jgi:DNA-directed RNA polymerase specialized sigma24 family protein